MHVFKNEISENLIAFAYCEYISIFVIGCVMRTVPYPTTKNVVAYATFVRFVYINLLNQYIHLKSTQPLPYERCAPMPDKCLPYMLNL